MLDDEFIDNLPEDPWRALEKVCKSFTEMATLAVDNEQALHIDIEYYDSFVDFWSLVHAIVEENHIILDIDEIPSNPSKHENMNEIAGLFSNLEDYVIGESTRIRFRNSSSMFKSALGKGFYYEFSDETIEKIQTLINELRDLIADSELFQEDHKRRLLQRLARLQSELHKKISDLDRFWGLVGDAGVMLGKFGKDVKPIVDRIREIADIVWRAQATAEQLPGDQKFPMLRDDEEG